VATAAEGGPRLKAKAAGVYEGSKRSAWLAFLAALFALPLSEAEAEVWRACTGRSAPSAKPFSEAWLVCGRPPASRL
jgi:hypothetical protein